MTQNGQKKRDLYTMPCGLLGLCSEARPRPRELVTPKKETWSQWAHQLQEESLGSSALWMRTMFILVALHRITEHSTRENSPPKTLRSFQMADFKNQCISAAGPWLCAERAIM